MYPEADYYKLKNHTKSPQNKIQKEQITKENYTVFSRIAVVYRKSFKVTSLLRKAGKTISQKTVARIMKEQGLQSELKKI